ncbi:hypothetical protein Mal4_44590 [Maioricimonas rarisocia]|uniref:Cytochrome C Planctomycete-type domain-containing protein n=1 Tax=Maioricimonas rarisocia TaxID=2528026 RepID=A0A517ZC72_9PLAN|nr:c-type cytochrome domain-containing protein [Maioricimonas rarisocia]QDU40104.1 hypothetical protein Mal4_44590 [Maioricimonas rarisocia]
MSRLCPILAAVMLLLPVAVRADDDNDELARQARSVLRRHCLRCHNGSGSEGGDFDILNVTHLVDEYGLVTDGDPADSLLLERVVEETMPPFEIRERTPVTAGEAEILRRWIAEGAAVFPVGEGREFIQLTDVLQAMHDFLRTQRPEDRQFIRFFTLHNLYNNSRILSEDLPIYRAALSKALNSLSNQSRIALPRAIDTASHLGSGRAGSLSETVYAIDVRDYGWDEDDLWTEVIRAYPYGVSYENLLDDRLQQLDGEIVRMSGSDLPMIRADWFITTAMRPPLYHALLRIPDTADELEQQLDVDIPGRFRQPAANRLARAGFAKSGVSGQNRMVERTDGAFGAYWKSYDFKPGRKRAKLSRFPLGPRNLFAGTSHPFDAQAFEHDGGEIIWHLPNGLQGYMLIDGEGGRIDEGPIDVVSDALKTSGTPAIVNGVSCMACHKHGMIPFQDSIRDHSAVFGAAQRKVQDLYPAASVMQQLVEQDRERFMEALEECIGPFLKTGANKDTPIEDFPEPVAEVARLHRLVFLDLETVACELNIEDPQQLILRVGLRTLKELGLDALAQKDGVISRLDWEAFEGTSLMQDLASQLGFTPQIVF